MESLGNPDLKNNPENFKPCDFSHNDINIHKLFHTKESCT